MGPVIAQPHLIEGERLLRPVSVPTGDLEPVSIGFDRKQELAAEEMRLAFVGVDRHHLRIDRRAELFTDDQGTRVEIKCFL